MGLEMRIRQIAESARIRTDIHGYHNGQTDFTLYIEENGKVLGKLDASEFEGVPSIHMIEVYDKGKGYGKKLVQELQSMYPSVEIIWGVTTEEGERLRNSLSYKKIKTPYYDEIVEYERLTKELDEYQKQADAYYQIENPTDEEKQAFFKMIELMNDAADRHYELEEYVWNKKKYYNIVKF